MVKQVQKDEVLSHQLWISPDDRDGTSENGKCLQVSQPALSGMGVQNQPSVQHGFARVWLSSDRADHRILYHGSCSQMWVAS